MEAIISRNDKIVQTLIDAGANVNIAVQNKLTPLMLASRGGYPITVKTLLNAEANVHAKSNLA